MTTTSQRRTTARQERARRTKDAFASLGQDFGGWAATLTADRTAPAQPTLASGIEWLAEGQRISVYCYGQDARGQHHPLLLHTDGTIEAPRHGGRRHLSDELFLASLAGHAPACVLAAHLITSGLPVTRDSQIAFGGSWLAVHNKVRAMWTATQWAVQRPGADWQALAAYFRFGLTPTLYDSWIDSDWTLKQASPFIRTFASVEVANLWRAAGKTTMASAKLAGAGQQPDDALPWKRAGFTDRNAEPWQRMKQPLSPADAWRWHAAGVTAHQFGVLRKYANAGSFAWSVPLAEALELVEAGSSAYEVRHWYPETRVMRAGADSWSQVLDYLRAGIGLRLFMAASDVAALTGDPFATAATVQRWLSHGVETFGEYQTLSAS